MKRFLLAGATLLALATAQPAIAADAPVYRKGPPPAVAAFDWSGFYIGANVGYAWGTTTATDVVASNGACWFICDSQWGTNVSGFTGGLQAGWNVQMQSLVLGIEIDGGYLGLKGTGVNPFAGGGTTVVETAGGWFATVRGRGGVLVTPTMLAYLTAGGIYADTRSNVHTTVAPPVPISTSNAAGWGWTVGGGVEARIDRNWSWKLEYLYYDLGTQRVGGICCGGGVTQFFTIKQTGNIIRLGLNWKL